MINISQFFHVLNLLVKNTYKKDGNFVDFLINSCLKPKPKNTQFRPLHSAPQTVFHFTSLNPSTQRADS